MKKNQEYHVVYNKKDQKWYEFASDLEIDKIPTLIEQRRVIPIMKSLNIDKNKDTK